MFNTLAGKSFMNFVHTLKTFNNVTSSLKFGHPAVICKTVLCRDLSCAMEPLEAVVKPTDSFSAKYISICTIQMVSFIYLFIYLFVYLFIGNQKEYNL